MKQTPHKTLICKCVDCKEKFEHIFQLARRETPKRCHPCKVRYLYQNSKKRKTLALK